MLRYDVAALRKIDARPDASAERFAHLQNRIGYAKGSDKPRKGFAPPRRGNVDALNVIKVLPAADRRVWEDAIINTKRNEPCSIAGPLFQLVNRVGQLCVGVSLIPIDPCARKNGNKEIARSDPLAYFIFPASPGRNVIPIDPYSDAVFLKQLDKVISKSQIFANVRNKDVGHKIVAFAYGSSQFIAAATPRALSFSARPSTNSPLLSQR